MMVYYSKIGGKFYPLVFSLGAKKQVKQIYGTLARIKLYSQSQEHTELETVESSAAGIDVVTTLAEIMIKQGVAYKNHFEKDYKIRPNSAADENGVWYGISKEEIEAVITDEEFNSLSDKIFTAIKNSNGTIKTKSKNNKATQEQQ
ncbi:MAG: hypothetical protein ACLUFN_07525 [Eubacterium sp.]